MQEVDEEDKGGTQISTPGGNQTVTTVNESGLYTLLFHLKPTMARGVSSEEIEEKELLLKRFKKWVTSEVLPSIRKHGGYLTPEKTRELIANPDLIIELAQNLKAEQEKRRQAELLAQRNEETIRLQDKVILAVQPKVQYYEQVLAAEDGILTNVIAKELGMSAHTLNKKLKEMGVIYRQGESWLLYHKYQGKGLTKTKTYTYTGSDGKQHTNIQTVWTQKGRELIHQLIEANE